MQARLEAAKPRVLAEGDKDAVHDLRVALRRTRTILDVGRSVFGRFHADEVRRALGKVQRATGVLRDEEVFLDLIASLTLGPERCDVEKWIEVRKRRERDLRGELRRGLRAGNLDRGLRLLDAMLMFPVKPSRDRRLTKFARRAVEDEKREVERRRAAPSNDAEELHELRMSYKRLRYTVETFAEAPGGDLAVPFAQSAARFQGLLGHIHDADVAEAAVRRARGLSSEARAAVLHRLSELRAGRLRAYDKARATVRDRTMAGVYASGTDSLRKTSTR